jgi:hypothetical protein
MQAAEAAGLKASWWEDNIRIVLGLCMCAPWSHRLVLGVFKNICFDIASPVLGNKRCAELVEWGSSAET